MLFNVRAKSKNRNRNITKRFNTWLYLHILNSYSHAYKMCFLHKKELKW